MSSNWVTNLDMLADAGVIDYDAAAFVNGTKPRYSGSLRNTLPNALKIKSQPMADGYYKKPKNQPWKKILLSGLIVAGGIFGIRKIKIKKFNDIKMPDFVTKFLEKLKKVKISGKTVDKN